MTRELLSQDAREMKIGPCLFTGCLLLWQMLPPSWLYAQDGARWPVTMVDSASLHAVACVDGQAAWAVGERGAMLSTTDGGATWNPYHARLTENTLSGVSFADPEHGIIVGGDARPYQLPSAGIVLRTRNAGQTWESADRTILPRLRRVTHTDARTALALGDSSPLFLSGIFRTADGGRSWNCVPTRHTRDWGDGDLTHPEQILLTSCDGELSRCANSRVVDIKQADQALRGLSDVAWISADHAIAVGNQGTLLESLDQGRTWWRLTSLARHPLSQQFDFRTVWAKRGFVWLAGSPGTHIFRSTDDGQTWGVAETGQSLPLNCLDFSDPQHGIAVGDFGVILVTRDGGKSWQVSRGQDYRAGLLVACQTNADIPFDLIAQLSGIDQLRCHVVVLEASAAGMRSATAAAKLVGADNVEGLDGAEQAILKTQLTSRLLAYRPDVVVVADLEHGHDNASLLLRQMKDAIQLAGDATSLGANHGQAFSPWKVKRLFHATSSRKPAPGSITIDTAAPILPLKSSVSAAMIGAYSFVDEARDGTVPESLRGSPTKGTCFVADTMQSESPPAATFLGGLELPFGSESRRALPESPVDEVWLRRRATAHHTTVSLMERAVSMGDDTGVQQLAPLTRDLPAEDRAGVLMWVVGRCQQYGRSALAQHTLDAVLQMQTHDVHETAAALARFRYSASSELRQFLRGKSAPGLATPAPAATDGIRQTTYVGSHDLPSADTRPRETAGPQADVAAMLEQLPPDVTSQPWVQLALASTRRRAADPQDRHRIYKLLQSKVANVEWRRCVAIEAWLADLQPDPRRPVPPDVIFLSRTDIPPILDGQLEEPAWLNAAPIRLNSSHDGDLATMVHITTDENYLFVALECEGGPPEPESAAQAGSRDADLLAFDHVDLRLDVDRDYSSGWQISVDSRGRASDRLDGDPAWNPTWHLATRRHASGWIAELAIPLRELTTDKIPLKDRCSSTWLVGIRRQAAGTACQTWPSGAGDELRWQRCGYLVVGPPEVF